MLRLCTAAAMLLFPLTGSPIQVPQSAPTTQAHLPKLEELLVQVREAQGAVSANQLRYLCRETVNTTSREPNTGGQLTDTAVFETFYVHQQAVSRLLERNHKPLTDSEQTAEEARVQHQIQVANAAAIPPAATWENTLGGLILLHARLVHERRMLVDGRPAIALDIRTQDHSSITPGLSAAPGTYHFNMLQVIAERVEGELWIDEQDHVIIRMDASAPRDLTFEGMLLAPKGFQVACYTTARIGDGVYVPKDWCGTVLPMQPLKAPEAVALWNGRVRRTAYALDGCRLYRSTAHIVSGPVIEATKP